MTCLPASIGREFGDLARVVVGIISRPLSPKKSSKIRPIGCGLIEAETIERVVTQGQNLILINPTILTNWSTISIRKENIFSSDRQDNGTPLFQRDGAFRIFVKEISRQSEETEMYLSTEVRLRFFCCPHKNLVTMNLLHIIKVTILSVCGLSLTVATPSVKANLVFELTRFLADLSVKKRVCV